MKLQKMKPWNWFKSEQQEDPGDRRAEMMRSRDNEPRMALSRFHDEFDRLFDGMFGLDRRSGDSLFDLGGLMPGLRDAMVKPTLDISEDDENYRIKVEVPGVKKDDIKVEFVNNALVISGEKEQETEDRNKRFHCVERSYGSFRRVLNMPPDADTDKVEARFKDGVLTLTLAKAEVAPSESKTISIEG